MSRSGYEYCDDSSSWLYRGAVARATNGKRGQSFLTALLAALDAMDPKRLVAGDLETPDGQVCAIGALGRQRGIDMSKIDPEDSNKVAKTFGIADALAREIVWVNDEAGPYNGEETPEQRWLRVRAAVFAMIKKTS